MSEIKVERMMVERVDRVGSVKERELREVKITCQLMGRECVNDLDYRIGNREFGVLIQGFPEAENERIGVLVIPEIWDAMKYQIDEMMKARIKK